LHSTIPERWALFSATLRGILHNVRRPRLVFHLRGRVVGETLELMAAISFGLPARRSGCWKQEFAD
jgi:hypothetical protein